MMDGTGSSKPPIGMPFKRLTSDVNTKTNLDLIQQRMDRQHLIQQALLRLLIEKGLLTEDEINQWIDYIDGLDGKVDGKITLKNGPIVCPNCSRVSRPGAMKCMYCGSEFARTAVETPNAK